MLNVVSFTCWTPDKKLLMGLLISVAGKRCREHPFSYVAEWNLT